MSSVCRVIFEGIWSIQAMDEEDARVTKWKGVKFGNRGLAHWLARRARPQLPESVLWRSAWRVAPGLQFWAIMPGAMLARRATPAGVNYFVILNYGTHNLLRCFK